MYQAIRFFLLILLTYTLTGCMHTVHIRYDASVNDYTPIICKILNDNPKGRLVLKFDKRVYNFYPEQAPQEFLSLSNNCSGDKKVAFLFNGMKDVTVDANGAAFIFHGKIVPFSIMHSENVEIRDLSVDYDYPWTFEAEVISNDATQRSFVVRVLPGHKYRIDSGRLFFGGYDWEYPMGEGVVFDPSTRRPYYEADAYYHGYWAGEMGAREISEGIIEFTRMNAREVPPVGSIFDDKGPTHLNRSYPGLAILSSKNVTVQDVHIFNSGAMALIAEYSENIHVSGFSTTQQAGSPRMVTASADATHFVDCKGLIQLENCQLESMRDDGINVHGVYMTVDSVLATNALIASFGHFQQLGNRFADAGNLLRIVDRYTLQPVTTLKLVDIDRSDRSKYILTVDGDLSTIASHPGRYAVENTTRGASVIIRNCVVRQNQARSVLISTPGDILIEECAFSSQMAGIRICGDANFWFESGNTRNVVIRGNHFTDHAIGGREPQAILQIDPIIPHDARTEDFFYHDRIIFENNKIFTFDNPLIYALSVKSLSILNNSFVETGTYPPFFPDLPSIDIQYCGIVEIAGNDFSQWKQDASIRTYHCKNVNTDTMLQVEESINPFFYQY